MGWDFETEPAFQAKLDWITTFVREEVDPLEFVLGNPPKHDVKLKVDNPQIDASNVTPGSTPFSAAQAQGAATSGLRTKLAAQNGQVVSIGAGAAVLKADTETGVLSTHLHADGSKKELLWNPVGVSAGFNKDEPNNGIRIHMKGNDVFKYAVKALDGVVDETLQANGLDKHDLDWLIPHQANLRIIEATAKRLDMSMDQVIVTVDKHGNTSSGSVPLALDTAIRSGRVERGQLLLLEAFGGGFTWGSVLLRY